MDFITLTHKFQVAPELNPCRAQFALVCLWAAPMMVDESQGKSFKSCFHVPGPILNMCQACAVANQHPQPTAGTP